MRPSISMSLEPGLERGVPWGRDLYTFVTSAAGHMMRTLQKPRKSRPSKRQVNHRRFLHNMIQRKFADIEAANHRLASALYFKDGDKNTSSLLSHKTETPPPLENPTQGVSLQGPDEYSTQKDADSTSKPRNDASTGLYETEVSEKKQLDIEHLWKSHPKSQFSTSTTGMNNQSKRKQKERRSHKLAELSFLSSPKDLDYFHETELFDSECYHDESQPKPIIDLSEDTQAHLNDSSVVHSAQHDGSPSFSLEFSPLSVDSCDLAVQMFTDLSSCTQNHKNIAESQLTDITELFNVEGKDSEGSMDVEAYLESICACQSNAGLEVCADYDVMFADLSDNFTGQKDLLSEEGESRYGYGCHGDQALNTKYCQSNQRSSQTSKQSKHTAEIQLNHLKPPQSADIIQNQLPTSISYHYNPTQLQMHQRSQEGSRYKLVNDENSLNFTSFEGVAQSFSAPPQDLMDRAIATPPREDDWLFTDILMDRKSPTTFCFD